MHQYLHNKIYNPFEIMLDIVIAFLHIPSVTEKFEKIYDHYTTHNYDYDDFQKYKYG